MKVQVTKTFAKALNAAFKAAGIPYDAAFIECDYSTCGADYNAKTGRYNCIGVFYPADYYAMPQYLTTYDLHKAYRPGDSAETYFDRLIETLEI